MKLTDLSLEIREGMITFPVMWHPYVEISQLGRFEVEGRETRKIVVGTHTGTHVDAPRHFVQNGTTIEALSLEQFYGSAKLLDYSNLPDKTEITIDMLRAKLKDDKPEKIIFRYDWDDRLDTMEYYTHHPFLSSEACQYIVDIGVNLVGFDAPMPDNPINGKGSKIDSPNHTILLSAGVVILEYLCNLKFISSEEFIISALPLKIKEGDGSPVRAIGIEKCL